MTGPIDSNIGDNTERILQLFLTRMPHRISVGEGKTVFTAILVNIANDSGRATSIERIYREVE